jgi:peroxiredoxin
MLQLGMMYQRFHTPESGFDILGIAVDDNQADVKKFAADSKAPFPLVLDRRRELANAYLIRSLPTALIVDTDGKVVYGGVGVAQGRQNDFARHLGLPQGGFRMEMGAPRGRGN